MSELANLLLKQLAERSVEPEENLFDRLKKIKLQADISANSIANGKGLSAGGRLGLNLPLNNANLNVGASGGGAYIPSQKVKEFNIDRVDASFDKGPNTYSVDFDPKDMRKNFMLNFTHNF